MEHLKIDGHLFARMIQEGAKNLERNVKTVDALNVFPVPDGDTGTNMNLSFTSGVNEMNKKKSRSVSEVSKALSKGLLMGARGNSGVILSQLFRGFGKAIENSEELNAKQFSNALQLGVETAYKAVMKPVEGTILTVAKDAAKAAYKKVKLTNDITELMEAVLKEAKASLQRTPDLLPILKQVGVVDSGGQGLVYVYEGFLSVLKGESIISEQTEKALDLGQDSVNNKEEHVRSEVTEMMAAGLLSVDDILYGYCTEFMIRLAPSKADQFNEDQFRQNIDQFGDSLLVISDEELVKVHIHAEELHKVMELAQDFGQLTNIKIENMREQFLAIQDSSVNERTKEEKVEKESKPFGIITVSMGDGIAEIFKSLGADVVIAGGQTMNPSTEDFVKASEQIYAQNIFILPNNGNVILAAEQSAELVNTSVTVIPTKNVPQGLAALLRFNATASLDENKELMLQAKDQITAGQVTYAIRDTKIDDVEIKKDQFMGIMNGKIVISAEDMLNCTIKLIAQMVTEVSEIITLIYGEDVQEGNADQLVEYLEKEYPDLEIELHYGGQPVYSYLISVE